MRPDSLGDRMKAYESLADIRLMRRTPVVVRLDGKNFSILTKRLKLEKPFDRRLLSAMSETMVSVASRIQGCVVGYTHSDEISLVLVNSTSLDTEPYFNNRIQKIASITASMAAVRFNRLLNLSKLVDEAYFDSRVFAVPTSVEAMNALIWRQQDCTRNSILSAAYHEIGKAKGRKTAQKMMYGLNTSELQELLFRETGINWSAHYAPELKRGTVAHRMMVEVETPNGKAVRHKWISEAAKVFQSEDGKAWLLSLLDKATDIGEEAPDAG